MNKEDLKVYESLQQINVDDINGQFFEEGEKQFSKLPQILELLSKDIQEANENFLKCNIYQRTVFGGTFNYFHLGHKYIISCASLLTEKFFYLGVGTCVLSKKKKYHSAMESDETRINRVQKFLDLFNPNSHESSLNKLSDRYGPLLKQDFDALIICDVQVKNNGEHINKIRLEKEMSKLNIHTIDQINDDAFKEELVNSQWKTKLSSTSTRSFIVQKSGGEDNLLFLKKEWFSLAAQFIKDDVIINLIFDQFMVYYSEYWRYYHTLNHICELLKLVNKYEKLIKDMKVVKMAIWFHDIIYIPQRKDNEKKSAEFFLDLFQNQYQQLLTEQEISKIERYILDTENHLKRRENEIDMDLDIFLDCDFSIVGTNWEVYKQYMKKIRNEYINYNDKDFKKGRCAFLEGILKKSEDKQVFRTKLFQIDEGYGNRFQENIKKEIEFLSNNQ